MQGCGLGKGPAAHLPERVVGQQPAMPGPSGLYLLENSGIRLPGRGVRHDS